MNDTWTWTAKDNEYLNDNFITFKFGDRYSKEFNIFRVSEGSRYNESLLPALQNKTVPVPDGDGAYYFGSVFTQRQINISIAFDSLTEQGFREMRQWLSSDKIQPLVFSECPYKYYMVKVAAPPQLKYICFDDKNTRVYKGEGSINFVAFFPYALSTCKYKDQFLFGEEKKKPVFDDASDWDSFLQNKSSYDTPVWNTNIWQIELVNSGDMDERPIITIPAFEMETKITLSICQGDSIEAYGNLTLKNVSNKGMIIDMKEGFILIDGNIRNDLIIAGDFFDIKMGECLLKISGLNENVIPSISHQFLYY